MLLQFSFKNCLSFKEETILDMTAIHAYKEHEYNLLDTGKKEKLLRVSAIYGANASGKSSLIEAFGIFRILVLTSFNNAKDNEASILSSYYQPFLFENDKKDTEYEIIMLDNENEYQYGFIYNDKIIVNEWLYVKNSKTNRRIKILERESNKISFGPSVMKECSIYKEQISEETLVLSFFNKLKTKTKTFKRVYELIDNTMILLNSNIYKDSMVLNKMLPALIDNRKVDILDFLSAIETGITDIRYEKNKEVVHFYVGHVGRDSHMYELNLFDESEGTLKALRIFIYVLVAIGGDRVLMIDELNSKLHPLLMKCLIDIFYETESLAQLIYTTHDTTLLDKKFFRRDQIWFVQKDEFGCSELYSLADFKVRSDASFEKDYLSGVYGGIPLIKDFEISEDKKTLSEKKNGKE